MVSSVYTINPPQYDFPPQGQTAPTPSPVVSNPVNAEEIQINSRTKMSIAHLVSETYESVFAEPQIPVVVEPVVVAPAIVEVQNEKPKTNRSRVWSRDMLKFFINVCVLIELRNYKLRKLHFN